MAQENKTFFFVIAYDIPNDRRRTKVASALEDYASRVQYSVFEANLTGAQYRQLRTKLKQLINAEEDSVRYYRLCEKCLGGVKVVGRGQLTTDPDLYIV